MNKYHSILSLILSDGRCQANRKGDIISLLNQQLTLTPSDLLDIFESHGIARKKLRCELSLFMSGERQTEKYRDAGINWWDYPEDSVFVDMFGGSGLLSHIKARHPKSCHIQLLG